MVWPSQRGDRDVKVMHTQGHRMCFSVLPLYHIKFGENRLNGMGTVAKILLWPLTLGWPWSQGHVWNGHSINLFHTKFDENRINDICTVAKIIKMTFTLQWPWPLTIGQNKWRKSKPLNIVYISCKFGKNPLSHLGVIALWLFHDCKTPNIEKWSVVTLKTHKLKKRKVRASTPMIRPFGDTCSVLVKWTSFSIEPATLFVVKSRFSRKNCAFRHLWPWAL